MRLRHTESRTLDTFKAVRERDAMQERGIALRTVQAWLGHKSLDTKDLYGLLQPNSVLLSDFFSQGVNNSKSGQQLHIAQRCVTI